MKRIFLSTLLILVFSAFLCDYKGLLCGSQGREGYGFTECLHHPFHNPINGRLPPATDRPPSHAA